MRISQDSEGLIIRCACGFALFKQSVLRNKVILIEGGYMLIKCPQCKRMSESVSLTLFLKEA